MPDSVADDGGTRVAAAPQVADGTIECWLHGSRFELRTGRPLTPPATRPVPTFPVRVAGGDVYLRGTTRSGRR